MAFGNHVSIVKTHKHDESELMPDHKKGTGAAFYQPASQPASLGTTQKLITQKTRERKAHEDNENIINPGWNLTMKSLERQKSLTTQHWMARFTAPPSELNHAMNT